MGIRRPGTKGYEEVDGVNVSSPPSANNGNGINNNLTVPEFELASVSVVPDGERQLHDVYFFGNFLQIVQFLTLSDYFRHIYGSASCQCFGLWLVSGEIVTVCWTLLDERLDGDDDSFGAWTSASL